MADSQITIWDDVAVVHAAKVDIGVWVCSSSGVDSVPFARSVALGADGGSHVEGTACLDLLWRQAL